VPADAVAGVSLGTARRHLRIERRGGEPPQGREADEIRRELRPRLEQHLERTRARFEALLTPEQRAKFERLYREDRRAERFFLENPPRPAPPAPNRPGPPPDEGPPR